LAKQECRKALCLSLRSLDKRTLAERYKTWLALGAVGKTMKIMMVGLMVCLVGCAANMEQANMKALGINDDKLKEKVSFDTGCAPAQIQVVRKREDQGSGDYVLNVCGKEKTYHRSGTVYYADGVDPLAAAAK
jgi:hypothetical protein